MEDAHFAYVIALLKKEKNRHMDLVNKFIVKNPCRANQSMIAIEAIESTIKVLQKNQKKEN